MIRSSQQGFTTRKSFLTNLFASCGGMTAWIDEGRVVDDVYLDLSKASDAVFHCIPIAQLAKYAPNMCTYMARLPGLKGGQQQQQHKI